MQLGNFLTITAANIRIHYKYTLLPAVVLLVGIPFVYGTANLDYVQSADCLERMVALTGIPMFTALVRQEHARGLYETTALRSIPWRWILLLRILLSVTGTLLLIFVFEIYMIANGCSFPLFSYTFRTLAAGMALGFTGLLLSAILQNTIGGYAGAFCLYFFVQAGNAGDFFKPAVHGVSFPLLLFLWGTGLAIACFCKPVFR